MTPLCIYGENICNCCFIFFVSVSGEFWVVLQILTDDITTCGCKGECIFIAEIFLLELIYNTLENEIAIACKHK